MLALTYKKLVKAKEVENRSIVTQPVSSEVKFSSLTPWFWSPCPWPLHHTSKQEICIEVKAFNSWFSRRNMEPLGKSSSCLWLEIYYAFSWKRKRKKHKKKYCWDLNSYFMDVKYQGCYKVTVVSDLFRRCFLEVVAQQYCANSHKGKSGS